MEVTMQFQGYLWLRLLLLLLLVILKGAVNYSKCAHINGRWLASVSSLWLFRATITGRTQVACAEALATYGPIVRIAPTKVVTNEPWIIQYMTSPRSNFTRGPWYEAFNTTPDRTNVLSECDEKRHRQLRGNLMRGYSGRDLPNLEQDIEYRISDLLALIEHRSAQGHPVDVAKLASYFTLDVLTQQGFEQPVGYLKQDRDIYSFIESVKQFAVVSELGSHFPRFQALLSSRIMAPLRPKTTDKTELGAMMGIAKGVVDKRFSQADEAAPKIDMLGSWMRCGLSAGKAENESITETLGGSDSTATAIRMIFLNVTSNPVVYWKLMAELGSCPKPAIKQSDAKAMPYLQACIKEGLRICPPLGGLGTRLPPPGGATLNGIFIPAGIEVGVNMYSAQRDRKIFGTDADIFRPERWLQTEHGAEELKEMEKTVDLVFSSGKYSCLGKTVAFMMLDKVLPALLVNYTWTFVNPAQPMRVLHTRRLQFCGYTTHQSRQALIVVFLWVSFGVVSRDSEQFN